MPEWSSFMNPRRTPIVLLLGVISMSGALVSISCSRDANDEKAAATKTGETTPIAASSAASPTAAQPTASAAAAG